MPNCGVLASQAAKGAKQASARLSRIATRKATKAANPCPAGGCRKPAKRGVLIPKHNPKKC